jgi:outer membrane protein assembly factor BamB
VVDNTIVVIGRQTLLGFSPADGTERWRADFDQDSIGAFPGVSANTIYVVSSAGTVFNLNASTGATRWQVDTPGTGFPDILLTLSADSVTVAASETVINVDTTDGTENWRYAPSGVNAIETTFERGTVYVHADDSLVALDLATGVEQWQTPITGPPTGIGPRTISGTVVAPSTATITGVAADSGQVRGERTFDGTGDVRLTPVDGGPLLVSRGGRVYGVDSSTITEQWAFDTDTNAAVIAESTQTRAIVGAGDGTVYALSTDSTAGGGDESGSGDDDDGSNQPGGFESGTPPATYDANGNGTITARELGQAVTDYATGNLTAAELGEVVTAFAIG